MKNLMILITLTLTLTACGQNPHLWQTNVPGATTTVTVTSTDSELQEVLEQENAYLESIGQHDLIPGLACTLYTVPTSTTSIAQANSCGGGETWQASFPYVGAFNQPIAPVTSGLNVLPTVLQSVFQTYFILKCTGYMVNLDNNYHSFSLTSDDGSLLTIGSPLINNDGAHVTQTVSAVKQMNVGMYWVELDFYQAGGMQSLILSEDGNVMDGSQFYH
jgi:hypothetical protein